MPATMAPVQCEVASGRHVGREASVEPGGGDHHAEAVRADKPQAVRPRSLLRRVGERVGVVTQSRGDNDRRRGALRTRRRDDLGHRRRGHCDHDDVGHLGDRSTELTVDKPSMYS
jgi:hypothetical protein